MSKETVQTLEDIAKLANVSKSTVSRALNNSPLINQDTKTKIQAIAREHHFRINVPARNLRLRESRTIAFISPDCGQHFSFDEDLFGTEILSSIGRGLHLLGYDMLIVHIDVRDTGWAQFYLDSGRADGFIMLETHHEHTLVKTLTEINAPFIVWGLPLPNHHYCSVSGDNINGGLLATRHLMNIGRHNVAFLGGAANDITVQNRYKGYENALLAAGRIVEPAKVAYGDYSYNSGMDTMQHLLEGSPNIDAVFVNSDLMAIGAITTIHNSGRRVPEDIAVVGYDDLPIARYNNLPLTTIRQNIALSGKLLGQNLIQYIQTGVVTNVTTPVELVIRKSA